MTRPTDRFPLALSRPWGYALALLLFGLALLLRFVVLPVEAGLAYLTFYPAAVFGFYLLGNGPGWLVVVLGGAAGYFVFTPPFWSLQPSFGGVIALLIYLLSGLLVDRVVGQLQASSGKLRDALATLELSERRYRAIVEDQSELICRFRADGVVLYVNEAYCRFFGKSADAVVGSRWHPLAHPDDVPLIDRELSLLSPARPVCTLENRVFAAEGGLRWGQFVNRGIFDDAGRLLEIQSVGRDVTERRALEGELAATVARMQDLYDNAPCGYHSLSADGTVLQINATELAWLGRTRDEVVGKMNIAEIFTAEGRAQFRELFPRFVASGVIEGVEFDLIGRDGRMRRVIVSATAVRDADGRFLMSRSVMYDITELTRTKAQLRQMTVEQNAMLDNDLIGIAKLEGSHPVWLNRGLHRIFGYANGELVGRSAEILFPDAAAMDALEQAARPVLRGGTALRSQCEMRRKDGSRLWIDISAVLLSEERRESLWILTDLTDQKKAQAQVEYIAVHDPLTGLPNRRLLSDRLDQALSLACRTQGKLAVCYLDLDDFKPVNDRFGHEIGDRLLIEMAHRLQACVRSHDTVARLGGDEFALVLTNLHGFEECEVVLRRVIAEASRAFSIGANAQARVSASVGVALFPDDGQEPDALLRLADQAMYRAKARGRNQFCRHSPPGGAD